MSDCEWIDHAESEMREKKKEQRHLFLSTKFYRHTHIEHKYLQFISKIRKKCEATAKVYKKRRKKETVAPF